MRSAWHIAPDLNQSCLSPRSWNLEDNTKLLAVQLAALAMAQLCAIAVTSSWPALSTHTSCTSHNLHTRPSQSCNRWDRKSARVPLVLLYHRLHTLPAPCISILSPLPPKLGSFFMWLSPLKTTYICFATKIPLSPPEFHAQPHTSVASLPSWICALSIDVSTFSVVCIISHKFRLEGCKNRLLPKLQAFLS